jgi:dimethylamine/trimethylamine dehydrogenase
MVTSRVANDTLFYSLQAYMEQEAGNKILTVGRVGDCLAPAAIFQAVYTGHKYARDFEETPEATVAKRERVGLENVRVV